VFGVWAVIWAQVGGGQDGGGEFRSGGKVDCWYWDGGEVDFGLRVCCLC
jgi:hypothetical protein